jgi:glycosyltransferase involved in cell wall biosynthesis
MTHIGMVLIGDIRYDGRVRKEIATLVDAGYDVELVVSDFNKGGSNRGGSETPIHYVPMTLHPSPTRNFLEQLLFNWKAASILKDLHLSHVHCHDLSSLLAGVWVKGKVKATLVFDAHELMPESMGGYRESVWGFIERRCIKHCDYILMPEKNRIAYFQKKYPNISPPLLLENFPRKSEISTGRFDLFRNIYSIKKWQKIILYTGLLAPGRYLEELIDSMSLCGEEFVLMIIGRAFKGYEKFLRQKTEKLGLDHKVFLQDAVPYTEILHYMASCDIGTAFYRNTNLNNYYCASNKVYEYIALQKVVLTNNYPGLLEAVENFGQGLCLEEITPRNLAMAYLRANDPARIKPGARKFFWEDQADSLIKLYER